MNATTMSAYLLGSVLLLLAISMTTDAVPRRRAPDGHFGGLCLPGFPKSTVGGECCPGNVMCTPGSGLKCNNGICEEYEEGTKIDKGRQGAAPPPWNSKALGFTPGGGQLYDELKEALGRVKEDLEALAE